MGRKRDYVDQNIYGMFKPRENSLKPEDNTTLQVRVQQEYEIWLTNIITNRFTWHNLPESVSERFTELCLYNYGMAVFYEDFNYGKMVLRGAPSGRLNMIDEPTSFNVYGNSYVNKVLSARDCVPIYNNNTRTGLAQTVELWSKRLAEIDTTLSINTINMRMPFIFTGPEEQQLSMRNWWDSVLKGEPATFHYNGGVGAESVSTFPVNHDPRNIEQLLNSKSRIMSDILTLIGINNSDRDKKERLISGEVEANNEFIVSSRNVAIKSRQEACRLINKQYGLNIEVEFNTDLMESIVEYGMIGGQQNAYVHNANA